MTRAKKIVVLGGRTFREIHQLIEDINASGRLSYEVIALLDDNEELHGTVICGVEVKGPLSEAHHYPDDTMFVLAINNSRRRIQRMNIVHRLGLSSDRFPPLIHPTAVIDRSTKIGYGTQIYQFCTTAHNVCFGEFCMISPYSLLALDCTIGNGVLMGARVTVLGNVKIGACSFIGSGSLLMEGTIIGPAAFVGAGSVVLQDVLPGHFTMGNPARQQIRNIHVPKYLSDTDNNE